MRAFFYDTWALVALANRRDPHHAVAAEIDRALEANAYAAVTSDYVLDETLTLAHRVAGSGAAMALLDALESRLEGGDLQLVEVGGPRRSDALRVFKKLAPQVPRLSFTDATTFVIMRELGIELAFTADRHFHQAGGSIRPIVEVVGRRARSTLGG